MHSALARQLPNDRDHLLGGVPCGVARDHQQHQACRIVDGQIRAVRIDAQELRCGGIVLAVIEIMEFVSHMSRCGLVVQLTVEPARATLWYCDALAVIIVDLCVTIPCGISDGCNASLFIERYCSFDKRALGIALEDDAQAVWTIYAILVGVDMHAAMIYAASGHDAIDDPTVTPNADRRFMPHFYRSS